MQNNSRKEQKKANSQFKKPFINKSIICHHDFLVEGEISGLDYNVIHSPLNLTVPDDIESEFSENTLA